MEGQLMQSGLSRHGAHVKIAKQFGYCTGTVYRALTPQRLTWERAYEKRRRHPRSPEGLAHRKAYNTKYVRTMRHMKEYADYLLDQQESFELLELAEAVSIKSRIRPELGTLAKRLKKYGDKIGVEEYEAGRYRKTSNVCFNPHLHKIPCGTPIP